MKEKYASEGMKPGDGKKMGQRIELAGKTGDGFASATAMSDAPYARGKSAKNDGCVGNVPATPPAK